MDETTNEFDREDAADDRTVADAAQAEFDAEDDGEETDGGTVIQDTDIVFDCPHCGHNLAIDYRGAGLQIACVNCGESVLVPIPDGMKIDDLDIEPGEILKQLFATRRNLQRTEALVAELQNALSDMTQRRDALKQVIEAFAVRLEEIKELGKNQTKLCAKSAKVLEQISADLAATVGDVANGEELDEEAVVADAAE